MTDFVWMVPAEGGEPRQVEAKTETLVPLMVAGWRQCDPPAKRKEVKPHVDD
jgi:hypothetical protein